MAKFKLGDTAIYIDKITGIPYTVKILSILIDYHYRTCVYDCFDNSTCLTLYKMDEGRLMTSHEFQLYSASSNIFDDVAIQSNTFNEPKCICGAHKVKDSGHSLWCKIK